jgi:hypothetical protein
MGVVLLLLLAFAFTVTGQWHWFGDPAAASWVQAIVSVFAICVGAAAVWWQVKRQAVAQSVAERAEQVRRLQLIGAAVFHCRFNIEVMFRMQSHPIKDELNELRVGLDALQAIPVLEYPDWRAFQGVANAAAALTSNFARIEQLDRDQSDNGITRRLLFLNTVLVALEKAEAMTQVALRERGADLKPIGMGINSDTIYSRSHAMWRSG